MCRSRLSIAKSTRVRCWTACWTGSILLTLVAFLLPATSTAGQVTLAWDASGGSVSGYRLFARAEGQAYNYSQPSWQGASTSCTISTQDSVANYFVVRAFDPQGNESGDSNEVALASGAVGGSTTPPDLPVAQSPAGNASDVELEPDLMTRAFSTSVPTDRHYRTHWQVFRSADQSCVFDLYTEAFLTELTVPPLVLEGRTAYTWTAQHYNQAGVASLPSAAAPFTTAAWTADADGNGIPDNQQITAATDLDRNGRTDGEQTDMKRFKSALGSQKIGIQASSANATVRLTAAQAVDPATVSSPSSSQPTFPVGLYNCKMTVSAPGEPVTLMIHFETLVSDAYHFYMFDPAVGHVDFGTRGLIAPNGQTATIQIQDGSEGDMDGVANGVVVAMGGYGSAPAASNLGGGGGDSGGGGGGCFIRSLFK